MQEKDYLNGLLLVAKPVGPTSHDVVLALRKALGMRKVGHAGTLDPLAEGLLVILLGNATKLAQYIPSDPKEYEGTMILGMKTDTMDLEGRPVGGQPFRGEVEDVKRSFAELVGERVQVPPAYSAAKVNGKPLHRYARKGIYMEGRPKKITVYSADVLEMHREEAGPVVRFRISCSPGTYIRELVDAVGDALGCGGVLSSLKRWRSGPFLLEDALPLDRILSFPEEARKNIIPPLSALPHMKRLRLEGKAAHKARCGSSLHQEDTLEMPELEKGELVAVVEDESLLGVYLVVSPRPAILRPLRVFPDA